MSMRLPAVNREGQDGRRGDAKRRLTECIGHAGRKIARPPSQGKFRLPASNGLETADASQTMPGPPMARAFNRCREA